MAATASSAPSWRKMQIPRPLQRLFDRFPLRTYDANDLPERSHHLTSSDLPTLFVFSTDHDARLGLPSFNPTCLKWQTLLRLTDLDFRILPSTNHASPTGSLPFLLPPRRPSPSQPSPSPSHPPPPIPASQLLAYARQHTKPPAARHDGQDGPLPPRAQAYLALVASPLRNAWLHALYLDGSHAALLARLYTRPASSSRAVQAALLRQLRRAAAEQIVASGGSGGGPVAADAESVDEGAVYASAREALAALATLLGESGTGWFFGAERPGSFDAAVFSYTHLMMEFMDGEGETALGGMVRRAGGGELARHREMMLRAAWPEWDAAEKS